MIEHKPLSIIKNKKNTIVFIVGTAMAIGSIVVSYTQLVYELGVESQRNNTGVELGHNFELKTKILDREELDLNQKTVNFKNIYLVEYSEPIPEGSELVVYKIRKIVDTPEFTKEIGTIVTKKKQPKTNSIIKELWEKFEKTLSNLPKENLFIQSAYAQEEQFNWYGHENNYNFYERYVDKYTIYRFYDDGWILEYKVDEAGASIPTSFKWVRKK